MTIFVHSVLTLLPGAFVGGAAALLIYAGDRPARPSERKPMTLPRVPIFPPSISAALGWTMVALILMFGLSVGWLAGSGGTVPLVAVAVSFGLVIMAFLRGNHMIDDYWNERAEDLERRFTP